MSADCFALVRGSAIRATDLTTRGSITEPVRYAASKSVARVSLDVMVDDGAHETLRNDSDEPRLHFVTNDSVVRYTADISLLRTDPGILSIMTGVPLVTNALGNVVGFDADTRLPVKAFALEVWSRLVGSRVKWGYTVFPFLKGGSVGGFVFENGLVSFNVTGTRTQRRGRWGVGPWDVEGPYQRLYVPVSGNTHWRQVTTTLAPPTQTDGTQTFSDIIDGGTASTTTADVIDGGTASVSSGWIIDGGAAS